MEVPRQNPDSYPNQRFSNAESVAIGEELSHLEKIGAIRVCSPVEGQFLSSIFLIPKSNGDKRFILNLKKLNKHILTQHFKMEDFRTASRLMSPNCYMLNLDLKEAYFLVPIHDDHKKYLRFKFKDNLFEFTALPFGLCTAPYLFTKLLKPVAALLRSQGLLSAIYLDDFLCLAGSYKNCLQNAMQTISLLCRLGFLINYEKSNLVPSKICKFLGFLFNSENMCLELPPEKKQKIFDLVRHNMTKTRISIRDFSHVIGTLIAACPAVAYGWAHTKSFERAKFLALNCNDGNYDKIMNIPQHLSYDFQWWESNIWQSRNPIRLFDYKIEIFTDASTTGWGAACGTEKTGGFWTADEQMHHINYLELMAAYLGLKTFADNLSNCEILLRVDNTTAVSYINRMGGIQFLHLNEIAQKIWRWCEMRQVFVFASYIKSSQNVDADSESRKLNIDTEWALSSQAFEKIVATFGDPEIDLFASRVNAKCIRYVSWKRDPYAYNVDAFTISWHNFFFYAFPPFAVILKVLQKIIGDRATGIVVVPYWESQPWYPLFKSLAIGNIVTFPPSKNLLSSVFRQAHPLHRHLSLAAAVLSGKHFCENKCHNPQ